MRKILGYLVLGYLAGGAAGLALSSGVSAAASRLPSGLPPSAALLLRYDANHDGIITREELEAGIKADFDAANPEHNGCLNPAEVRAENERRLKRDGDQASPVVDWNLDGCVDLKEFGTAYRSYFDLADRAKNGRVTLTELRGPAMPIAPPQTDQAKNSDKNGGNKNAGPGASSSPPTGPAGASY